MIQAVVQCDKCGNTAQIMGGFQRYNNNIIGFGLPDNWYYLGTTVVCDRCLTKIVEEKND